MHEPGEAGAVVWARHRGDLSPHPRRWQRADRTEGPIWVSGSTLAPWSALVDPSTHPLRIATDTPTNQKLQADKQGPHTSKALPTGPIDGDPIEVYSGMTIPAVGALLDEALSGIPLGRYDQSIVEWIKDVWDQPSVVTIASLITRARAAGPANEGAGQ